MALRRWKPFLGSFVHIDAAIEAAGAVSRDEFRSARAPIVEMLCGCDDDGVAEGLCLLLDAAMAECLVTLRAAAAEVPPGMLASGELVAAVGALMAGHASERVRGLARDVVRGWRAGVEEELAGARAAIDGLSAPPPPERTAASDTKRKAKIPKQQLPPPPRPKKATTVAPVAGSGRVSTEKISDRRRGEDMATMEATKRKLHERYQEAEDAKRRRTIRVIEAPPPPGRTTRPAVRRRFSTSSSSSSLRRV
ncbi:hypothetical protein ACP4OV_015274 [Aristida adscensionis]